MRSDAVKPVEDHDPRKVDPVELPKPTLSAGAEEAPAAYHHPGQRQRKEGPPERVGDNADVGNPGALDVGERAAGRASKPRDDERVSEKRPRQHRVGGRRDEAGDRARHGEGHLRDPGD